MSSIIQIDIPLSQQEIDSKKAKRLLEPLEYFKDNLAYFVAAFAEYYHEDFDFVYEKFANIFPVFHMNLQDNLNNLMNEYGSVNVSNNYGKYCKYAANNKTLSNELHKKYLNSYLSSIVDFLPEKYRHWCQEFIDSNYSGFFIFECKNRCQGLEEIVGGLDKISLFDYFATEIENKLNDSLTEDFEKANILQNRIRFLNFIGIDNGDDYSKYSDYFNLFPSCEVADEVIKNRKHFNYLYNKELYKRLYPNSEYFKKAKEEDLSLKLLSGFFHIPITGFFLNPTVINRNGEFKLYPIMFIDVNCISGVDERTIHELNHIFELLLLELKDNLATIKNGFEIFTYKVSDDLEDEEQIAEEKKIPRKYERFNEIINELISLDIYNIFKKIKGSVFDKEDDVFINYSDYLKQAYIVEDFFENFKPEILEARKSSTLDVLFEAVGRDNFDALNDLVNEDFETINHTQLDKELASNFEIETEEIKKYNAIVEKRNVILEKMKIHYSERIDSVK